MAFIYTTTRRKVELTLSADDIGVLFEAPDVTAGAVRAVRRARLHEDSSRAYGRVMLLHEPAAARAGFATVRDALPLQAMRRVKRTVPVYIEQTSGLRMLPTREIAVRFKPGVTGARRSRLLTSLNLAERWSNEFHPRQYMVASTREVDEQEAMELANTLSENDDIVEYAAPNFISEHRKGAKTNDRLLSSQWHLNNSGKSAALAGEDVDAFSAWDVTSGNSDILIAIVDDGVDLGHLDLQKNIWVNPNPAAPDRNGRNFYDDDFDPQPRYFHRPYDQLEGNDIHGTSCAGVAAAVGNNRRGVAGIAHGCKILPVKIFGADDLAPNDRVADAIRYAGQHAQVISCSWSGPWNPDLESAIDDVVQGGRGGKGCLVFCATGNEYQSGIAFPAEHPQALAVGASNDQGIRSMYSNYGQDIEFVAPSSDPDRGRAAITTTDVMRRNRGFTLRGSYARDFGGTSSATPLAAGIAALVLSVKPSLTWVEVRDILRATAEKIDQQGGNYQNGFSLEYGYGRLNAYEAVKAAQSHAG